MRAAAAPSAPRKAASRNTQPQPHNGFVYAICRFELSIDVLSHCRTAREDAREAESPKVRKAQCKECKEHTRSSH